MTRRSAVLDALEPTATASLCGADLHALGLAPGDLMTVRSRRGQVTLHVRQDDGTPTGAVFIPFACYEAATNMMTKAALDPFGKIPEFKYCAVAIEQGGMAESLCQPGSGNFRLVVIRERPLFGTLARIEQANNPKTLEKKAIPNLM